MFPRRSSAHAGVLGTQLRRRNFYQATADFFRPNPDGKPASSKVDIKIGDPENTYVMIPPNIGYALRGGNKASTVSQRDDRFKLFFDHDTQEFSHGNFATSFPIYLVEITYFY